MARHSSILAWEMPRTGSLVSYSPWGYKRVGHDLATKQQQDALRAFVHSSNWKQGGRQGWGWDMVGIWGWYF